MSENILYEHGLIGGQIGGASAEEVLDYTKQIANLTAIADIYGRVPSGAQSVMYDLLDGTNDRSAGIIDTYKGVTQAAYSAATTTMVVDTTVGLANGEEVTLQDDVSKEAKIVSSFVAGTVAINPGGTKTVTPTSATVATTGSYTRTAKSVTAVGNAAISTAQFKNGASSGYFDGFGDYLTITDSPDFSTGLKDYTIQFWIKRITVGAIMRICGQSDASGSLGTIANVVGFDATNHVTAIFYVGATPYVATSIGVISDTTAWHHIAVVRNGGTVTIYIDGVADGTVNVAGITPDNSTANFSIARNGSFDGAYYHGYIDEFEFANGVARYTANFTPHTSALVGDAYTVLLLHCEGTNGSTTFTDDNTAVTVSPKIGTGMASFGASASYLTVPHSTDFSMGTSDFTIECWVHGQLANTKVIFAKSITSGGAGNYSFLVTCDSGGGITALAYTGSERGVAVASRVAVLTTGWNHVAFVRNGSTISLYVNGTSVGTPDTAAGAAIIDNASWPLSIGGVAWSAAGSIGSYIDEFRLSKGIARYTANFTPPTAAFTTDAFTKLLIHADGTNGSTVFPDSSEQAGVNNSITFTAGTTNAYKSGALVYRSNYEISGGKLKIPSWGTTRTLSQKSVTAVGDAKLVTSASLRSGKILSTVGNARIVNEGIGKSVTAVGNARVLTKGTTKVASVAGNARIVEAGVDGKTVSVVGNTKISGATSKMGGTSGWFNASGGYLSVPDSPDWTLGSSDFTIRAFLNFSALPAVGYYAMIYCHFSTNNTNLFAIKNIGGTYHLVFVAERGGAVIINIDATITTPALNTWYHMQVTREANVYKLFIDGVQQGVSTTNTNGLTDLTGVLTVGGYVGSENLNGYMDEFELAVGIARSATVPTSPLAPDAYTKLLLHFEGENESTTFVDSSSLIAPKTGTSMGYFDGTGDYLTFPDSDDWNFGTGDFTIRSKFCWSSLPTASTWQALYQQYASATDYQVFFIYNTAGIYSWNFTVVSGGVTRIVFSTIGNLALAANTWYDFQFSRNGNDFRFFKDGVQQGATQVSSASIPDLSGPLQIGNNSAGGQNFNGYLDELEISKGIARNTANFTPSTEEITPDQYTKLLLHFNAKHGSTNFYDDSIGIRPKSGTGMAYFDGVGDYLTIPDSEDWNFGTGDFTIKGYCMFNALPMPANSMALVGQIIDFSNYWGLFIYNSLGTYKMYLESCVGGVFQISLIRDITIGINTWYHLALVRSGTSFVLYLDGVQIGSVYTSSGSMANHAAVLTIGSLGAASYMNGYIDELEIAKGIARHTANFTPSTSIVADQYTKLLLRGNGVHESTLFLDSSTGILPKYGTGIGYFGSTGDYLTTPDSADWTFGMGDFTISSYVNFSVLPLNGWTSTVVGHYADANNLYKFGLYNMLGEYKLRINVFGSGVDLVNLYSTALTVVIGTWYHIELTRSGGTYRLFFNGVLVATEVNASSVPDFAGTLRIATLETSASQSFVGYIEDLEIAKGVARHTATFTPGAVVPDAYTVLHIPFDGAYNSKYFVDNSGGGSAITPVYGTSMGQFDGSGDYLTTPDSNDWYFATSDWTWDGWFNFKAKSGTMCLLSQFIDINDRLHFYYNGDNNQFGAIHYAGGSAVVDCLASITLTVGIWYHVALQSRSGTYEIYVNGVKLTTTGDATGGTVSNLSAPVEIGRQNYSSNYAYFNGWMKGVRITKGLARYTSNFTPSQSSAIVDATTALLLDMEGSNGSTTFTDQLSSLSPLLTTDIRYPITLPLGTAKELALWVEQEVEDSTFSTVATMSIVGAGANENFASTTKTTSAVTAGVENQFLGTGATGARMTEKITLTRSTESIDKGLTKITGAIA